MPITEVLYLPFPFLPSFLPFSSAYLLSCIVINGVALEIQTNINVTDLLYFHTPVCGVCGVCGVWCVYVCVVCVVCVRVQQGRAFTLYNVHASEQSDNCTPPQVSLVPRPHPQGEGLVTSG